METETPQLSLLKSEKKSIIARYRAAFTRLQEDEKKELEVIDRLIAQFEPKAEAKKLSIPLQVLAFIKTIDAEFSLEDLYTYIKSSAPELEIKRERLSAIIFNLKEDDQVEMVKPKSSRSDPAIYRFKG